MQTIILPIHALGTQDLEYILNHIGTGVGAANICKRFRW